MVRPGAVTEPAIDYSTWAMAMPYAGGGLGYLVSLAWLVRRRLHAANHRRAPHNDPLIGAAPVCVRCGYEAAADRPCPECGLENPLALRRVYFGRWHARLMLSRWRWVAVLPWVAVVVLFFWPLISGVARHWLG
ncbi:MAG: hypothetical protein FJ255_00115 [Phycisphaerae bacterium]|nr:hypothetical protein [Phycisphaerae bacterium]